MTELAETLAPIQARLTQAAQADRDLADALRHLGGAVERVDLVGAQLALLGSCHADPQ